jgi:hypothetical protein
MVIENKDYGNPETEIKSSGIFKSSASNLDFMTEEMKLQEC